MDSTVLAAIIETSGTVLSSIIGVTGVFLIVKSRKDIIYLSNQVEAYHKHEGNLVKKILELEEKEPIPTVIQNRRGKLRTELTPAGEEKPSMTDTQAKRLRVKYLSF